MINMLRSVAFFLFLLGSVFSLGPDLALADTAPGTKLVVATEGQYPPFNYFENKKLTGFEIDLITEIAKILKVSVEWKTFGFDSLLIGLSQKRYDVAIASFGITKEREKAVDFTDPYYCSGGIILSHTGGPKTKEALRGKTIGAGVGTTYAKLLAESKEWKTRTYPNDLAAVQGLLAHKVDAIVSDQLVLIQLKKENKIPGTEVGDFLNLERMGMAVAKGNSALRDSLNQALKQVLKDGTYAGLSKKYFSEDIRCK